MLSQAERFFRLSRLLVCLFVVGCGSVPQQNQSTSTSTSNPTSQPSGPQSPWAAILVGKGPDALFMTPDSRFVYVANVEDQTVSVIDVSKKRLVKDIRVVGNPWGFARLGETNLIAVSNWNKGIDIIDFEKQKVVRSKQYPHHLGGIVATTKGNTLYVVSTEDDQVLKIDAQSLEIQEKYKTESGPDGIGMSHDGTKIYVTNTKTGSISIINLETKKHSSIKTGGKPELVHSNHKRTKLYISNFTNNVVHILDTKTDKIIHEIKGLEGPEEAVISNSEKLLYVVNFKNSKVYVYDAETYVKQEQTYLVGKDPIGIISTQDDGRLFVTNYGSNSVSIITVD